MDTSSYMHAVVGQTFIVGNGRNSAHTTKSKDFTNELYVQA